MTLYCESCVFVCVSEHVAFTDTLSSGATRKPSSMTCSHSGVLTAGVQH